MKLYANFDEDMCVAIMMENTGMSYRELSETPDGVIFARNHLKKFKYENEKFFRESRVMHR